MCKLNVWIQLSLLTIKNIIWFIIAEMLFFKVFISVSFTDFGALLIVQFLAWYRFKAHVPFSAALCYPEAIAASDASGNMLHMVAESKASCIL